MKIETCVIVAPGPGAPEWRAAEVLREEVKLRTGEDWPIADEWPQRATAVAVSLSENDTLCGRPVPRRRGSFPENSAEGFRVLSDRESNTIWVIGADRRGCLYGVGMLLRKLELTRHSIAIDEQLDVASSPRYAMRGHQLGYRPTANSYDAWTPDQYDRYIRELALFGTNCIENIPFQDEDTNELMKLPRREMNRRISLICDKYDLDFWVWTPATVDLSDPNQLEEEVRKHEQLYKDCPRLDGVFVPGGDPGGNPPQVLLPFLQRISDKLRRYHPNAGVWVSLQGFKPEEVDYFFDYLEKHAPDWIEGVVSGPSSPPIPVTRERLPRKYRHRHYPDITHTVRCQYPVLWWDQAFALTLGREPCNPQPTYYAKIHNYFAPYTDGFLSYSDGVHDDVNKVVWTRLAWDPDSCVREIIVDYCRFFFGADVSEEAARGIFMLERNWEGPLSENESVERTLDHWRRLESGRPDLSSNWRWQLLLLRAYYDAYTRRRLIYEQELEEKAMLVLGEAGPGNLQAPMKRALELVQKADRDKVAPDLRRRIEELCCALFESIGLQTSVPRFHASGYERGCVLDFVDYPLNNRWWLEDEFEKIHRMDDERSKLERIKIIREWEHPPAGSFYDDVGNVAKSPHLEKGLQQPTFAWWDSGFSRARLSFQVYMSRPRLRYEGLAPDASYTIRLTGYGEALLEVDGERIEPTRYEREPGGFKEFPIPRRLTSKGWIEVSFADPGEQHLNWRHRSRISDIWLLKDNIP